MNKTESAQYIEDVRGEIIGDPTITCVLISNKTGNVNGRTSIFSNSEECIVWANARVAQLKQSLGDEFDRLFGDVGFELRILN